MEKSSGIEPAAVPRFPNRKVISGSSVLEILTFRVFLSLLLAAHDADQVVGSRAKISPMSFVIAASKENDLQSKRS